MILNKSRVIALLLPNARNQTFPLIERGNPSVHISLTRFVRLTLSQFGNISFSQVFFVRSSLRCLLSHSVRLRSILRILSFLRLRYSRVSSPGSLSRSSIIGPVYWSIALYWASDNPRFFEFPVRAIYCNKVLISEEEFLAKLAYSNWRVSSNVFSDFELCGVGTYSGSIALALDRLKLLKLSAREEIRPDPPPITTALLILPANDCSGVVSRLWSFFFDPSFGTSAIYESLKLDMSDGSMGAHSAITRTTAELFESEDSLCGKISITLLWWVRAGTLIDWTTLLSSVIRFNVWPVANIREES